MTLQFAQYLKRFGLRFKVELRVACIEHRLVGSSIMFSSSLEMRLDITGRTAGMADPEHNKRVIAHGKPFKPCI